MKAENLDRSWVIVSLLEECNFFCAHCAVVEGPMYPGYRLSFAQLELLLADAKKLDGIECIHFSGGEPSLWKEDGLNFTDVLIAVAKAGFRPSFITNGSAFTDAARCRGFLDAYFAGADRPLTIIVSVDDMHGNYDAVTERAAALDSILEYADDAPERRELLNVEAVAMRAKDGTPLVPPGLIEHYESKGIVFRYAGIIPRGRARERAYLTTEAKPLGRTIIFLADSDYYFVSPSGDWRPFAKLGELEENAVRKHISCT